jgi:hypothetical protein
MNQMSAEVIFFPIRHHSPACAWALLQAFDDLKPRQVLVEAPCDFLHLIPQLTDPQTRPPVALLSLPPEKEKDFTALYPFCAHSPEFVALRWAREHGARIDLIDLPARHKMMRRQTPEQDGAPAPLIAQWRLDHNAYVRELCARRGVADGLALWDALFESQAGTTDWRGFFHAAGLYCAQMREVTPLAEMEADGTLAREAQMAARLAAAKLEAGPIAVVTGGFHTPALAAPATAPIPDLAAPPPNAYLIRYGFRQLDHHSGYGAGLPHPAFYDRLWQSLHESEADFALHLMTDFADGLRREKPLLALATPTLAAAILAASRLAALRDLPAPGRTEIIDAIRSCGVKDAIELGTTPLLGALHDFLTGDGIGELPPGVAQPPLVASIRARLVALRFNLEVGATRSRDLDILRRPAHAQASRMLFTLDLIDAGFARRLAGPDPMTGWRGDALFETWSYAWSPMVEARLISRAAQGATLDAVALATLTDRYRALAESGQGGSAREAAALLVTAARTGIEAAIDLAAGWCAEAIAQEPQAAAIIGAISITAGLTRPGPGAPEFAPRFAALRTAAIQRLLLLFPDLAGTPADQLPALIRALADLGALLAVGDDALDRAAFEGVLHEALDRAPAPALHGALLAFAGLIGALPEPEVAARISALLAGVYVLPGEAAAVLTGGLAVAPRLIVHSPALLAAVDAFLAAADHEGFVAALPELRLAFSQLNPGEVDRIAAWVAAAHGLGLAEMHAAVVPASEMAENLKLSERMTETWREEGLAEWLA